VALKTDPRIRVPQGARLWQADHSRNEPFGPLAADRPE
jgi:hypothetical protein